MSLPSIWRESGDYLHGCDLYNHGYGGEAHEAWEGLWKTCDKTGPRGRLLHGLIQVAAPHLKLRLGRLDGTHRLLGRGLDHLRFVARKARSRTFTGLKLAQFAECVEANAPPRHRTNHGICDAWPIPRPQPPNDTQPPASRNRKEMQNQG